MARVAGNTWPSTGTQESPCEGANMAGGGTPPPPTQPAAAMIKPGSLACRTPACPHCARVHTQTPPARLPPCPWTRAPAGAPGEFCTRPSTGFQELPLSLQGFQSLSRWPHVSPEATLSSLPVPALPQHMWWLSTEQSAEGRLSRKHIHTCVTWGPSRSLSGPQSSHL